MLSRRTGARLRTSGAGRGAVTPRHATGHDDADAGERLVHAAVAVPGLQGRGEQHRGAQHDGGAPAHDPRCGGWRATFVGVVDEADLSGRWPSILCTLADRSGRGGGLRRSRTTPVRLSPSTMMVNAPNRSVSASVTISAAARAGFAVRITAANPAR
jgi:hypothetical protein